MGCGASTDVAPVIVRSKDGSDNAPSIEGTSKTSAKVSPFPENGGSATDPTATMQGVLDASLNASASGVTADVSLYLSAFDHTVLVDPAFAMGPKPGTTEASKIGGVGAKRLHARNCTLQVES